MLVNLALLPIEKLVNRTLQLDPENFAQLQELAGKSLAIDLVGPEFTLVILVSGRGLQFCSKQVQPATTTLRGTPLTLARMLLSEDPLAVLRTAEVSLSGDLEFMQSLHTLFTGLNIDWQEHLAHYLGNNLSVFLSNGLYASKVWQQELKQTLCQNTVEYLQEEARLLPPSEEVADFGRDVFALRLATDRLAARLQRLLDSTRIKHE